MFYTFFHRIELFQTFLKTSLVLANKNFDNASQAYITPNLSGGTREPEPSTEPGRGSIGITMASVRFGERTEKIQWYRTMQTDIFKNRQNQTQLFQIKPSIGNACRKR